MTSRGARPPACVAPPSRVHGRPDRASARPRDAGAALRPLASLSGGEQRRVAIAALLAQDPGTVLLDEPTNHLDPNQAIEVLDLFDERCRAGRSVVATLHDPTLAARYAHRVLLLHGDGRWAEGPADELLTSERLSELYGTRIGTARIGERRVFFAE